MRALIVAALATVGCAHAGSSTPAGQTSTFGREGSFSRSGARNAGTTVVRREVRPTAVPPTEPIDFGGSWGEGDDSDDGDDGAGSEGDASEGHGSESELPSSSAGESGDSP